MSLPVYDRYQDSGIEWLGYIPNSWKLKRLKYVATLRTDKAENRDAAVGLENIQGWTGRFLPSESEFEGAGVGFNSGDVLFGKLRPYLAKVWLADFDGEAVGDFHVMRPADDVHGRFLIYQMLTQDFISIVDGSTFGAKMPRASWDFMANMIMPVPRLEEQLAISHFLDAETSKIDGLVSEQRRLIELLKEKRQAVISHAVTKGLNPNAPMKPSGIDSIGAIPKHWTLKSLSLSAKRIAVGLATSVTKYYRNEGVPIIRNKNIKEGYFDGSDMLYLDEEFAESESSKAVLAGDVIAVHTGSNLGLACVVPDEFDQCHTFTTLVVTPSDELFNRYFTFCMNSLYGKAEVSRLKFGFGKDNLNVRDFKRFNILMPNFDEQVKICVYLDAELSKFDSLLEEAERAIELLRERRTALISAAVTGKVDVRGFVKQEVMT